MPSPPHVYYSPALKCWVLGDAWTVGIDHCTLTIPEGYLWDMASVPRILSPWIESFELGTAAPLVHDWSYQHGGVLANCWPVLTLTRSETDHLFYRMMRDEGVKWRKGPAFAAVRLFGWLAWKRKQDQGKGAHRPVPPPSPPPSTG
jgi:hypothetical protein